MQDSKLNKKTICINPFCYCEILDNGEVYPCCQEWCNYYSFGNIIEKSFDEIWNGEKAVNFRKKILSGDFSLCNTSNCTYNRCLSDIAWTNYVEANFNDNKGHGIIREIKMCWDKECNAACITCRDKINKNEKENLIKLEQIKKNLLPYIKDIDIFYCSGSGDPFASKYSRNLIKEIANLNKHIEFGIHTNGILATEKMFEKLGIKDRIHVIEISVQASTKETYNKIVKYGNFDKVIENIKWMAKYYKTNPIKNFVLTFVINNYNYKEIPDFIKLAENYNAKVCFYYFRYWNTNYGKGEEYDKISVWKPEHPKFNEFLEIINNPIVKDCKSYYHTDFRDLLNLEVKSL